MSNEVQNMQSAPATVRQFLAAKKNVLAQNLEGSVLKPERLLSVVMSEIRKVPQLADCDQNSLFGAIVQSAQLGLEPGSALGHCYLIPFKNTKANKTEVQFMLGYRGMIELARRSGQIESLSAREVYENDTFELRYGLHEDLVHIPARGAFKGSVIGYYAVARLVGGGAQFEFMDMEEIEAVKSRSKSASFSSSPWQSDPIAMGKKTVVRRLFKYLPVSVQALTAVGLDEAGDRGEQNNSAVIDHGTGEVVDQAPGGVAGALNSALS